MDRLKLGVGDRSLRNGGQRVVIAEFAEVRDQVWDELVRRRHVFGRAWVEGRATDPVLLATEPTPMGFQPRAGQQAAVDLEQQIDRQQVTCINLVDGIEHGIDVAKHFSDGHVTRWFTEPAPRCQRVR